MKLGVTLHEALDSSATELDWLLAIDGVVARQAKKERDG